METTEFLKLLNMVDQMGDMPAEFTATYIPNERSTVRMQLIRSPKADSSYPGPKPGPYSVVLRDKDNVPLAMSHFHIWTDISKVLRAFVVAKNDKDVAKAFHAFAPRFTVKSLMERIQSGVDGNGPTGLWYLSFANETGFLGGCFVEAKGASTATHRAHQLGINPGGEVLARESDPEKVPVDVRNRLLTKDQLTEVFGALSKATA